MSQNKDNSVNLKQEDAIQAILELLINQQISIDFMKSVILRNEAERAGLSEDDIKEKYSNFYRDSLEGYLNGLYERFGYIGNIDDFLNNR